MNKFNLPEYPFRLPNAKVVTSQTNVFQFYRGDFFSLFITAPGPVSDHDRFKKDHEKEDRVVRLLYQHKEFVFEFCFAPEDLFDFELPEGCVHLNDLIPCWSPGMEHALFAFFSTTLKGRLADRYIYARVVDLLFELVKEVKRVQSIPVVSERSVEIAKKGKEIIVQDFSIYHTIGELARQLRISKTELQRAFKSVYGISIGQFSREERLKAAHHILESSDVLLSVIALECGYNDPGNFSVAFKKFFGYPPGKVKIKSQIDDSIS